MLVVILAGLGGYIFITKEKPSLLDDFSCTQDAKQCPDGSYVSRTGSNCEFAECPASMAISSSKIVQGSVDIVEGKVIKKDGVIEITDNQGKMTRVVVKGSTDFDIVTILSPSRGHLFYGWGAGDGMDGFIYDFVTNTSYELGMVSAIKEVRWFPDGRFEYWVGCVTEYCIRHVSIDSSSPWETKTQ